jgi:hypothetical protein
MIVVDSTVTELDPKNARRGVVARRTSPGTRRVTSRRRNQGKVYIIVLGTLREPLQAVSDDGPVCGRIVILCRLDVLSRGSELMPRDWSACSP